MSLGKDMEHLRLPDIAGKNAKWCSLSRKEFVSCI